MPSDLLVEWGIRLRAEREKRGLAVAELADQAGITRQHLYRLEDGKHSPDDETRIQLAHALGIRVCDVWAYPDELVES
jgi:putative transcriptional regulator